MNITEINFNPLFQWINKRLGTSADFAIRLEGKRPTIVNVDNLWGDSGIFKSVIEKVSVNFFNYEFKDGTLWATVYLNYESWSGGRNGMQIGNVWYNPETGWKFETEKERCETYNQERPLRTIISNL